MKLLRRDADAALKALLVMAREEAKRQDTSSLAKQLAISRPFMRKILQLLQKRGFLQSRKGKGGGFWLAAQPDEVKIVKVIEAFQGPIELQECLLRVPLCPDLKTCVLREKILELEAELTAELRALTLKDLLEARGRTTFFPERKKGVKIE